MVKAYCLGLAFAVAACLPMTSGAESIESAYPAAKGLVAPAPGRARTQLPTPPAYKAGPAPAQPKSDMNGQLINGQPVPEGAFPEVVRIRTGGSGCTATVVGPRVILTAAHCGATGATSKFSIGSASYEAKLTRSSLYPGKDHDVSLGLLAKDIQGVKPAAIGGSAAKGVKLLLLGYGCTQPGGGGGNDGVLRMGETEISGFSGYDMESTMANGAALCFGDSGGPAFADGGGRRLLLGVNSKGNIRDTNWNARLDTPESQSFLKEFAEQNKVVICGVTPGC